MTRRARRSSLAGRPSLAADQGGAIMVVGLLMAVFLVGALYGLAGVGASVSYQERLQQATDEAAFGAAVEHARAMNAIATVNAANTVSYTVLAGAALAEHGGDLCVRFEIILGEGTPRDVYPGPDGFCRWLYDTYRDARQTMEPSLVNDMRRGTQAAETIASEAPQLAAEEAEALLRARLGSELRRGFLVPQAFAAKPSGTDAFCALANLHTHRLARIAMGLDIAYRIIGDENPYIGRSLPYCPEPSGVHAYVPDPPARPVATEPYQVRVVAVGDSDRLRFFARGVRIARIFSTHWVDAGRGRPDEVRPIASVAVSQAEYYSTWDLANVPEDLAQHSLEEEAFRTEWRARLRRFRYPTGGSPDPVVNDPIYEGWLTSTVLPVCGGACSDVRPDLRGARDALH